jgi:Domain of unknown function (DUF4249)
MKHAIIIISMFILMEVISCTERIEIETGHEFTRLIVDGTITTDTMAHSVILSSTSDYFSNQAVPKVSGATVTVSDGSLTYYLRETSPGVYKTNPDVYGMVGHRYALKIKLSYPIGGYSEYTASSVITPPARLDSIQLEFHPDYSLEGMWEVRGYFQDPAENNYYRFMVKRNAELVTDTLTEWYVTDDRFFNGRYVIGGTVAFLHQHRQDEALITGDRLTIEMDMINREYAEFILNAQSEMRGSYPLFSGPPANVKGNIDNGAIGFFAAYSISRASAYVPEKK